MMMMDWNEYRKQVGAAVADIARIAPDTVRGYSQLGNAAAKPGHLDAKTRELIAIAVGVTRQCDGCITVHIDAAVKAGATREEIMDALSVAVAVNAGAALVYSARALDAYAARTAPDTTGGPPRAQ